MHFMREYVDYDEWKAEREKVRDTLHVYDYKGNEVPDERIDDNFSDVWGIQVDDVEALDFLYRWHSTFDLLGRRYENVRGGTFLEYGHVYAYSSELDGWADLTKVSKVVDSLKERFMK